VRGRRGAELAERAPLFGMAVAIVVGTVPAAVFGLLIHDLIEARLSSDLRAAGALLMVTGGILFSVRYAPSADGAKLGPVRALAVGLAQAVAILPGISRSGSTIVAGRFVGLDGVQAARFSFLLAVPALIAAMVLQVVKSAGDGGLQAGGSALAVGLVVGTIAAGGVGVLCLKLLLSVIQRGKLHWFAAYCVPAGALMLAAGLMR